jgi:Mlc titration factor MtfA (ptsG expression regulator)
MIGLGIILAIGAALVVVVLAGPWRRARRRRSLIAAHAPPEWRTILLRQLPVFRRLPEDVRTSMLDAMKVFLAEKRFVGCNGLIVEDTMRVIVAAQACLLVARLGVHRYDSLNTILLYPHTFVAEHEHSDESGVHTIEAKELGGESWSDGKIVLSWEDVRAGLLAGEDAYNVVYHEFAHQLDQSDGSADGAPTLSGIHDYDRWATVLQAAYDELLRDLEHGRATLIPPEGAENESEFFAVATEVFMDRAQAMHSRHPALYAELRSFYGLDPASWYPAQAVI